MMGVILWIIVVLIGMGVAIVGMVLLVPIHVAMDWGSSGKRFRLRYLSGEFVYDKSQAENGIKLFGVTIIHWKTSEEKAAEAKEKKAKVKKKAKKKKKRTMGDWWEVWREYPDTMKIWLKQMGWLVYQVVRGLRIDHFRVKAVIATPDPYWTSVIYGYAEAVGWGLRLIPRVEINLNPDFKTDRPQGDVSLAVTYRMYRMTWAVMRFLWALPKWGSIKMIRSSRKGRKVV
jgi:hypothetical protein